jgi:alkylhydroperoxidase family enzyme
MRVFVPDNEQHDAAAYVGTTYAKSISAAAFQFSKATYQDSLLTMREFEGARARTAEINGCQVCQKFRAVRDIPEYMKYVGGNAEDSVASHGPAPDEAFYQSVSEWRTSSLYSDRERLAIEYAERMALEPQTLAMDDDFWGRAKGNFSDDELVDLSFCIACWMGTGRVMHVLGLDGACSFSAATVGAA